MRWGSSRIQNVVRVVLCAVLAALGLVNWWVMELEPLPPVAGAASAHAPAAPLSSLQPVNQRPLSDFEEFVRRPLFTASRSPFVPTGSTQTLAGPSVRPSDIRLAGVAIDAGKKQALLRTPQQPQGRWVEQGDSIDGWLLRSVRDDAVIVASGQQTHELRLYPTQDPSLRPQ
jgi:hypothetical protein